MPQGSMPNKPDEHQSDALKRAEQMVSASTPKERLSWKERIETAGVFTVFLVGGIGGGSLISEILLYFSAPLLLRDLIALIYWCSYGILFSKVELKSDAISNYHRGYSDGYVAGSEEGLSMGISAKSRGDYDLGYQAGLADGRTDGWDAGYAAAQHDRDNI